MRNISKHLVILLTSLYAISLSGQTKYDPLFGDVTMSEMEMKTYPPDPGTEAVVTFNAGDLRFVENTFGQFEVHLIKRIRIKIFNRDGYRFGEVDVPFRTSNDIKEPVIIKKASTYNLENGRITQTNYDPKSVFIEQINNKWKRLKLALPDIKDGSVIDYEYEYVTDSKTWLPGWDFQMTIPVISSKLTMRIVPYYQYQYILQGTNKFSSQSSKDGTDIKYFRDKPYYDKIYTFEMTDLPAFRDESYITSINDYLIRVDFQLSKINQPNGFSEDFVTTWTALSEELLKSDLFGKYISSSEKQAEKFLSNVDLSKLKKTEKIEKISDLIKSNFSWNGQESYTVSKTPKELIEQKTGNSADINLFLLACLKTADIEASPVLLSTRDNGKIKVNYPFLDSFNDVIIDARADSTHLLLDATNLFLPFDKLPINCINESGLIVQKKTESWINLSSADQSASLVENIDILADSEKDSLDCSVKILSNGYSALEMKMRTGIKYEKIKDDLISRGLYPSDSIRVENFKDPKKPYTLTFDSHPKIERLENKILIAPFFREAEQTNSLRSLERKYPVDLIYKIKKQFLTSVKIPAGYKVSYLPSNYSANNNLVNITYFTSSHDDMITLVGKYEFKKSVYGPEDYISLKNAISEIVKRFNDKIVFEKI